LFAGVDFAPSASVIEDGAAGARTGRGRGAFIWGFLLDIA
jgi:hypothetical protein